MAMSIESDPIYRTARLLSYRDQQADDLCAVLDGAVFLMTEVARVAEAALADLDPDGAPFGVMKTHAVALRRLAAHFAREAENTRQGWALKSSEERAP